MPSPIALKKPHAGHTEGRLLTKVGRKVQPIKRPTGCVAITPMTVDGVTFRGSSNKPPAACGGRRVFPHRPGTIGTGFGRARRGIDLGQSPRATSGDEKQREVDPWDCIRAWLREEIS